MRPDCAGVCALVLLDGLEMASSRGSAVDLFHEHGFTILRSVLTPAVVNDMKARVAAHIASEGDRHRLPLMGNKIGGWYVPGFPQRTELKQLYDVMVGRKKLRDALNELLGASHRPLSRNEIYVDRWGDWHRDRTYDALNLYACAPDLSSESAVQRLIAASSKGQLHKVWHSCNPQQNQSRLVTVVAYLQDHRDPANRQALTIRPGSHRSGGTRAGVERTLHPGLGDLILFNTELEHRAMRWQDALVDTLPAASGLNRTAVSITFGMAGDGHSASFERGFALRSELLSGFSRVCELAKPSLRDDLSMSHECAYTAALVDLLTNPLPTQSDLTRDGSRAIHPAAHTLPAFHDSQQAPYPWPYTFPTSWVGECAASQRASKQEWQLARRQQQPQEHAISRTLQTALMTTLCQWIAPTSAGGSG